MSITLAPGSEDNAFAVMLRDLIEQNLVGKANKQRAFDALARGGGVTIALVVDDADLALTLAFGQGSLVLHDGIKGVPDVAVRGVSEAIMNLSNIPLTRPFALPIPTDRTAVDVLRSTVASTRSGELQVFGILGNIRTLARFTRIMSVNG